MNKLISNLVALVIVTAVGMLFYILNLWRNKKL